MAIIEASMPRSVSFTLGEKKELSFEQHMKDVRNMITIVIGTMKELSAQAVEKYKVPGMRYLIGEILSCLGQAKVATSVKPSQLNFKQL